MAAGILGGGAAGMEDPGPAAGGQPGEFKFFERHGGDGGNPAPMLHGPGCGPAEFAKAAVRLVMRELKRKQGKRELIERCVVRGCGMIEDERAQLRGVAGESNGRCHAVLCDTAAGFPRQPMEVSAGSGQMSSQKRLGQGKARTTKARRHKGAPRKTPVRNFTETVNGERIRRFQ